MRQKKPNHSKLLAVLILSSLLMAPFLIQAGPLTSKIIIRNDETLFTTFAFITIGSFHEVDREKMNPLKEFVWRKLEKNLSPEYLERIRQECETFQKDRMFEYNATMLAINSSSPPEIRFLKRELVDHLQDKGEDRIQRALKTFQGLERLPELLTEFYQKANIQELYEECQPWYNDAINKYQEKVTSLLSRALEYLKMSEEEVHLVVEKIVIIPNLIGPRGSAMGPIWKNIKYDIHSPWESVSWSPHEFIHEMVAPLTRSGKYEESILTIVNKVWEDLEDTPARNYYSDKISFFDECLVRTLDHIASRGWEKPWEKERVRSGLVYQAERGFVLCPLMLEALEEYQTSGQSFKNYFPKFLQTLLRTRSSNDKKD